MTPYIDWCDGPDDSVSSVLASFEGYDWGDGKQHELSIAPDDVELIVAYYAYENYSGDALVVYRDRRDGKVYEVHGGHCSCYGLEGQWEPEEAVIAELLDRPEYVSAWVSQHAAEANRDIRRALEAALGGAT